MAPVKRKARAVENLAAERIVIPRRFNGPPASANGGYACGVVAALLGGRAEVTLRCPPPLDAPLSVTREGERVDVRDADGKLVAEAEPLELELDLPDPVSLADAERASRRYAGFLAHAYATCIVCGPARADGLRIFAGPGGRDGLVASPWLPTGQVGEEIAWAALDCPSGWAVDEFSREGVLLGRLAARIVAPVQAGRPHVVVGWPIGREGRKRYAGSAILAPDGRACAYARSTWLVPRA